MPKRSRPSAGRSRVVDVGVAIIPSPEALETLLARLEARARAGRASQVLYHVRNVRRAVADQDPVAAALAMFDAVRIVDALRDGPLVVAHIRRRGQLRRRGSEGGKARAAALAKRDAEIVRAARELRARHAKWSTARIARELAPGVSLSPRRVQTIIS